MTTAKINYDSAVAAFAVANTPMFLLRKLRSDSAVERLTQLFSTDKLFSDLVASLGKKPENLTDAVKPYALLVALSRKGNLALLKELLKYPAPFSEWFSEIANILIQTSMPLTTTAFTPPQYLGAERNNFATNSPTKSQSVSAKLDH